MIREYDPAVGEAGAFALEQAALEAGKRLANRDAASRRDNPMPGNSLTSRACGHGMSGGASPAGESSGACQLAVSGHAAFGNSSNQGVESVPVRAHAAKDNLKGMDLPVLPL